MDKQELVGWIVLVTAVVNLINAIINLIEKGSDSPKKKKSRKHK